MLIEIKKVRWCREGEYGYFQALSRNRGKLVISLKRNPTLEKYASTLLHEMLHVYTKLLEMDGFKVNSKKEHKWIYACEEAVTQLMVRHLGKRRN